MQDGGMETEHVHTEISRIQQLIADEEQKRIRYKVENIRRRHNYLPFIMELLKVLAEQGQLVELVDRAKEKTDERKKKEKDSKEAKATSVA
jgi:ubiquitin carboxyl-terminal hydrolase L5